MMKEFQLDIYTWPAMRGVPCDCRTSHHSTPDEAIDHLESRERPYAYAALQRNNKVGYFPCGWDGHKIKSNETWPVRWGTNGEHPMYLEIMAAWPDLITEVRRSYANTGVGTIDIASRILRKRWPEAMLAEKLGWAAAEPLDS